MEKDTWTMHDLHPEKLVIVVIIGLIILQNIVWNQTQQTMKTLTSIQNFSLDQYRLTRWIKTKRVTERTLCKQGLVEEKPTEIVLRCFQRTWWSSWKALHQNWQTVTPVIHTPRKVHVAFRDHVKTELLRIEQLRVIPRQDKPNDLVYSLVTVRKPNKIILCIDPKMTWIVRLQEAITTYKQSTK